MFISVAGTGTQSTNCLLFWDTDGAAYDLTNGTVVLTWDPLTPAAEELSLRVDGTSGSFEAAGTSPLTLEFDELANSPDDWGVTFAVDHDLPNVPVQQVVKLELAFDYLGDLPTPSKGTCSNGLS